MKRIQIYGACAALFLLNGCINNDVPFPIISGEVTSISIEGVNDVTIEASKRLITGTVGENIDIRQLLIESVSITEDSRMIDNYTHQEVDPDTPYMLDLTQGSGNYAVSTDPAYTFTVVTYQDYVWTLNLTQPIERYVEVPNQLGTAQFSATGNRVTVYVSEGYDLQNVTINRFKLGPAHATVSPDPSSVKDFRTPQKFTLTYFDIVEEWTVIFEESQQYVYNVQSDPWASFSYLSAEGLTSAGQCGFKVREAGSSGDWTEATDIVVSSGVFTGYIDGLTPSTTYTVRAYAGEYTGEDVTFTTDAAHAIPNLNFDTWTLDGNTWYPNETAANSWWATGNKGVTGFTTKPSNSAPTEDAISGYAVRMESVTVTLVGLAAGNIFAGDYETNIGSPAKSAIFGRPFTGRPLKLSGYYKYTPATVTHQGGNGNTTPHPGELNTPDHCTVYIRLEDWEGATVRPAVPKIIAYGGFESNQNVPSYTRFELDIEYYDTKTKPTHVILVASSSRYGDDFCGGDGSVMYVDEFELHY